MDTVRGPRREGRAEAVLGMCFSLVANGASYVSWIDRRLLLLLLLLDERGRVLMIEFCQLADKRDVVLRLLGALAIDCQAKCACDYGKKTHTGYWTAARVEVMTQVPVEDGLHVGSAVPQLVGFTRMQHATAFCWRCSLTFIPFEFERAASSTSHRTKSRLSSQNNTARGRMIGAVLFGLCPRVVGSSGAYRLQHVGPAVCRRVDCEAGRAR